MKRGMVIWVDLSDGSPPEMGRVRPAVVVSGTVHNERLETVVVVPTSSLAPEIWPLRILIGHFQGKDSYAVIPGIRQVWKGRLRGEIGQASDSCLASLDDCLRAYLR